MQRFKHIVAPTDLSSESLSTVSFAAHLAKAQGAKLTVLHVPHSLPVAYTDLAPPVTMVDIDRAIEKAATEQLERWAARHLRKIPRVTTLVRRGDTDAVICQVAAQVGAKVVRIFTAYEIDGQDLQAQWKRCVSAIREMCDRAAAHGVTIAIQNHHDIALHTEALLELLTDIDRPNCKLGFDAWSPALRGESLYDSARLAAPHTIITTNADYLKVPRYRHHPDLVNYERQAVDWVRAVPFGTGFIDYAAFFNGLRDGGFDGTAVFEMCSPLRGGGSRQNLDACATTYLRWMQARGLITA